MITYLFLRVGTKISRVVPLRILYALAGLAASLVSLAPTPFRAAARANIAQVTGLPEKSLQVRHAVVHAFRCQAYNYVDLMRMDRVTVADFNATVVPGNLSSLHEAYALGKGLIIVSAHLGNMDYVAQWLAFNDFPVHAAMERLKPDALHELVSRQRRGAGLQMHPVGPNIIGTLTSALRAGEVVTLVADRDISGNGETVSFFGAPAHLPLGPALLALRTGAPIVAAFGKRLTDKRLYVSAGPPVQLQRTHNLRADLAEGMRVIAHLLEEGIAATPEQWIVFERVWRGESHIAKEAVA